MIKIFFGEDRVTISSAVRKELGEDYEIFEGENLSADDLPNIFLGTSLFGETRKILIKDLSENKTVFEKILDYLKTTHDVVLWETKFDKRSAIYKTLSKEKIEMNEFKLLESMNSKEVFDIFDIALRDGQRAVKMVEKIQETNDPFMFVGLLASQAIKKFEFRQGRKEKRVLKELSNLDIQMKSTGIEPWTLIKLSLLKLSSL